MNKNYKVESNELILQASESFAKGEYQKAESLTREALQIAKSEENSHHIASAFHNLGTILSKMGRYDEALASYASALNRKESLGEDGSSKAATLNQLAQVYSATGNYAEAESLYRKSLSLIVKTQDRNSEAVTLSNLASVYSNIGRLSEAEALYKKALEIQESLGNWQAAKTYNNLGNLYLSLNDLEKAHKAFQRAIVLMSEHLGKDHPDTSSVVNNLAHVLAAQGNQKEADVLFSESLKNLQLSLGIEHPYVKNLIEKQAMLTKNANEKL